MTTDAKRLIDWCLTPTLAIFQLYCGVNILYNISSTTIPLKINLFRHKAKTRGNMNYEFEE